MNNIIDLTLLKPTATSKDFKELYETAKKLETFSVCVPSSEVANAVSYLDDGSNSVKVCTVVGFPLGNQSIDAKVEETKAALKHGADEIDMVVNLGYVKQHLWTDVEDEIHFIKEVCKDHVLKVIIETDYLTEDEIFKATQVCISAGADFVKTSTGFAMVKDSLSIKLMKVGIIREAIRFKNSDIRIKVSGGVKTTEDIQKCIDAGAHRIGTSTVSY